MSEPAIDISQSTQETGTELPEEQSIWNQETKERVQQFAQTVDEVKKEREALSAKINAEKAKLIDDGFNKDALEAAIKYARTEEEKRKNFDMTYIYCRQALGHPIQDDLFVAAMQQQVALTKVE